MPNLFHVILEEFEKEVDGTRRQLERIPGAKLTWRPHAKSMTIGELGMHIASNPEMIANLIALDGMDMSEMGFGPAQPSSTDEIMQCFQSGTEKCRNTLSRMDESAAFSPWKLTRDGGTIFEAPKIGLARSFFLNHLYHHRGELQVYLRLLDVPVPSLFGPSADENPFA